MSRSTPPRSFNTVKHSNREQRIKRLRLERKIMLSLLAVFCAITLTLIVFFICSTADLISNQEQNDPMDSEATDSKPPATSTDIVFQSVTKSNGDVHKGILVVVNEDHFFDASAATNLKNIFDHREKYEGIYNPYQIGESSWKLNAAALDAFNQMMLKYYALEEDGSIKISSAYRSHEDQENSTTSSTRAGHSDHHTGCCVALRTGNGGYLETDHWIYQNCYKYGYVLRYPESKSAITGVDGYEYCFRYVGPGHSDYIYENGYCLEEYVDLLRQAHNFDNPLKITAFDGGNYEVYYIPASSEELTTLKVPANYAYTVSGDNIGGFIVTVDLSEPLSAE